MNRYFKLLDIVKEKKPKHIVEIGTWNGKRAVEMMAVSNAYYTGFDLFEDASKKSDEEEMNVKQPADMMDVAKAMEMSGFNKFCLIRGNTLKTLPEWVNSDDFQPFDFAFIDGGHSVETIKSDYEHIKKAISPGGTIVLDDWYDPPLEGFGCNFIEDGELHPFSDEYCDNRGNTGQISLLVVEAKDGCN
jgi:predicted O-methyltransferase YrrM